MDSLCLVFVRMEGQPTARDETRDLSDRSDEPLEPVSSSGGNPEGLNDVGDVLRFRLRV